MLKKKIKFVDFNENEVEETHYFNLSKLELMEMELFGEGGSFNAWIQSIVEAEDRATLFAEFKKLILASYGEKSADGKMFIKEREGVKLSDQFAQTAAFEALFMDLATVTDAAVEFVRGVVPADMAGAATAPAEQAQAAPPAPPARTGG